MEWHQTPGNHGNHVFDVFDTIPLILLQSLERDGSSQLRCHQPPVVLPAAMKTAMKNMTYLALVGGMVESHRTYHASGLVPHSQYEVCVCEHKVK